MSPIVDAGYEAFAQGISKYENPYEPGSINFDDWKFGWELASDDRKEHLDSISPLKPEEL